MKRIPVAARTLCFLLWLLASSFHNSLQAQSFSIVPSQMEISVAPTFDHAPVHVAVTSTVQGFSVANLQLSSDSTWVKASADATNGQLILSFSTSSLTNSSYTATITAKSGTDSVSFFVKASVTPLNIIRLKGDPKRSRTYGIQQNGLLTGSVVILDPVTATHLGNITVGKKPCDIAESPDGLELLVINSVDQSISVIDLINLLVKETIKLPAYDNWGAADTAANVGFGPNGIVYYTDGAWTPNLRVFDRKTGKILQTTLIDGQYGFGNFALTGDFTSMFGWGQFGWNAGIVNSFIVRLAVASSGTVTFQEKTDSYYNNAFQRDPLNTPVLISSDNKTVFVKGLAVDASSVKNVKYQFPGPVYSITPGGEIAVTDKAIYETKTGNRIADLPVTAPVQTVSSDYSRLIYYDTSSRTLKTLNLLEIVGPNIINRQISPADGSITLSPAALSWPALPGIYRYRIYLDQSQTDVSNADPSSPAFLGEVTSPTFQLAAPLAPGATYYWRIDAITEFETIKGAVFSFTVSVISSSTSSISGATVKGHKGYSATFDIRSGDTPQAWTADSDQPWMTVTKASGVTPATVELRLDASALSPGIHHATVTISSGGAVLFTVPVDLKVEPLTLTILKSDPSSSKIYGISEDTSSVSSRAYLLEIDSQTETIQRVRPVGNAVSDLAIHHGDNRIYVPNWKAGSLLSIDLTTFDQVRSYAFSPFAGIGYSGGDVYRVSAGAAGRVVVEEQDQWINISIFDTGTGTVQGKKFVREGGGAFDPTGHYYYHGDNNISSAQIHKYDVTGDKFFELAHNGPSAGSSYYGSRTVVMADDGSRVFWNGSAFTRDLAESWNIGNEIYSTSSEGRFGFGMTKIFDVDRKQPVLGMPTDTKISAFNSSTRKLVVQLADSLRFYKITDPITLPAPILSVESTSINSVKLRWIDLSLEISFTLQWRPVNSSNWIDAGSIGRNVTTYTVSGLNAGTQYEFRIKAEASDFSSDWSDSVNATTLSTLTSNQSFNVSAGGVSYAATIGSSGPLQVGYVSANVETGTPPYATAVITVRQNGVVVSEVGVPSSPPTTMARIFIEQRSGVSLKLSPVNAGTVNVKTGMAMVNTGTDMAAITYILRSAAGSPIASGHGTMQPGSHQALFLDELGRYAPDFKLPPDFDTAIGYGTLDVVSNQPLSVLAVRLTLNQRQETLLTTTPVADLNKTSTSAPLFFPQFVDGAGSRTAIYLMNTTASMERGTIRFFNNGGDPLVVGFEGSATPSSQGSYAIFPNGFVTLFSDGSSSSANTGWIQITPEGATASPIGGAVFSYAPAGTLLTESGVPSVVPTTHARIYLDRTNGHRVGLALANLNSTSTSLTVQAFRTDGVSPVGIGSMNIVANGHISKFDSEIIPFIPPEFTGVLDINASAPIAPLTLRSLVNSRGEFLLATFPVADFNQQAPSPIIFPQIADGDGYQTEFILLSSGTGGRITLSLFDENGAALPLLKR